jgi:glycosyltransferase involved in cell wall biosynthesis
VKIIQVLPTLEQEASGPSYSVPRLAEALAQHGNEVRLMTAGGQAVAPSVRLDFQRFPRDLGQTPVLKTLELSRAMHRALRSQAPDVDIIHSNGLWTGPTLYPAWAARAAGKPLILSPRGTLSPVALRRSPVRKRVFWSLLQHRAVASAKLLHATSHQEYRDIRAIGLRQPVAVIPNGVDVPARPQSRPVRGQPRRLLYLGRLHPIKGLDLLLPAWSSISDRFPDWELRLVGPGPAEYRRHLAEIASAERIPRLHIEEARYGPEKLEEYMEADLFVLPSYSENFGMTVAEALAQGVPAIATTGTPWSGLLDNACGWHVAPEIHSLAAAMSEAMSMERGALRTMGENGRAWMQRSFGWRHIGAEMLAVYNWLLDQGPRPATIIVD